MKNVLRGIIFWTIAIAMILVATAIVNVLSEIITIKTIMTVVYIALGIGVIYIFKN